MSLFNIASWLRQTFPRTYRTAQRALPLRRKSLHLEALEDRVTPSTFTVLDNSDSATDTKSLRYALTNAASLSITTIDFDPSVRSITLSNNGNATGLVVANNLTITNDQGAGPVIIDGANLFTVFTVNAGVTATLSGLTIQHGVYNGYGGAGGGGIRNAGNLTLNNDSILNSTANGYANYPAYGGDGPGMGGGVYNSGMLTVQASTFSGDTAHGAGGSQYGVNGDGGDAEGGAIYNASSAVANITNSTFSGNSAQGGNTDYTTYGQAFSGYFYGYGGGGFGGAIYNVGTTTVTSSTIAGNTAAGGTGGYDGNGFGGGLDNQGTGFTVDSSIVAGNLVGTTSSPYGFYPDADGYFTDSGYNLVYNTAGSGGFTASNHDILGKDPLLSPLANNGGPTQTMALSAASPALDKGDPNNGVALDQRGIARPQSALPSIGALEPVLVFLSGGDVITAVEGNVSTLQTVAAFAVPRNNDINFAHYTATIDWGDGHQSAGSFALSMDGQTIFVQGSHTYGEEGSYTVSVSVADADSPVNTLPSTATSSATVADAPLTASAVAITPAEGQAVNNVLVATFTDGDPKGTAGDYTATINWGDGDSTASVSIAPDAIVPGQFDVTASKSSPYFEEGPYTVSVAIVDTDGNTSTTTASWVSGASLPAAKAELGVVEGADGRLYALGGYLGGYTNTAYAYTPSANAWTQVASMITGRIDFGAAAGLDGRIYAIGGYNYNAGGFLSSVEAYTPSTNSWASVASLPVPLAYFGTATGADGRIYVIGGTSASGHSSAVYAYTPSLNQWTQVASLPNGRAYLAAATGTDGRIYAIGGDDTSVGMTNTVYAYTPSTNSWVPVASMPAARDFLAATTGPDGRIYAIGGNDGSLGRANPVYVYTPSTDQWVALPASVLPTQPAFLGAATGADGRVYAIGGYDASTNAPTTVVEALTPRSAAVTNSPFVVSDPAVIATAGQAVVNAVAGGSTNLVLLATFTDPGGTEAIGDYSATVDWGDSTTSTPDTENTTDANPNIFIVQVGNRFLVEGTHVYATAGGYTITTTIHHDVAPDAVVHETVAVASTAVPPLSGTGQFTYTATEGLAPTGTQSVATFTDPSGADLDPSQPTPTPEPGVYAATVSWGDGSAPDASATITVNASGLFTVSDSHEYTEDGTYTISVLLQRTGAPNVTVTSTAVVADQPLTNLALATLPTTGVVGTGIGVGGQTVATFTDPAGFGDEVASKDFTAVINWGDGSTSSGTVTQGVTNGAYVVTAPADHVYTAAGNHTLSVTVTHDAEPSISVSQNIDVAKDATVVNWAQPADLTYGTPLGASQLDATATAVVNGTIVGIAGTYTYTLADDSTPASGAILHAGSGQTLNVSFTPTDAADYATTTGSTTLNINPAVSTITWTPPAGITYGTALGAAQLDAVISTVLNGTPHGVPGTFTYTLSDGVTPASGTVLNAGQSQTLRVTFTPATADYTNAVSSTTINVAQAASTVNTPTVPSGAVYNGQPQGASDSDVIGVNSADLGAPTLTYYSGSYSTVSQLGGQTPIGGVPLDAGTYTVLASFAGNPDYLASAALATYSIGQATPSVPVPTFPAGAFYNGQPWSATDGDVTGVNSADLGAPTLTYYQYINASTSNLLNGPPATTGTYFATASFAGNKDYKAASSSSSLFSIGQAAPTVPTPTVPTGAVYNGQQQGATDGDVIGVNGADLGAPTLTYYAGIHTLAQTGSLTGSTTPPTQAGAYTVTASAPSSQGYLAASSLATYSIAQATPTIAWPSPSDITYGAALGASQLDATATALVNGVNTSVAGTFTYTLADGTTPALGAVLHAGQGQTLKVTFTPMDGTDFTNVASSTILNVGQATPTLSWPTPADVTFGTPLGASQLDATATAVVNGASTPVAGIFTYTLADGVTPAGGVVLNVGNGQALKVTFAPTDSADFTGASTGTTLNVNSPLQISESSLPAGTAGSAYTQTITVSGGTAPYTTFSVTGFSGGTTGLTSGAVVANGPAGTVAISGTPTEAGVASFTLNVNDSGGATFSKTYTLTVAPVVTASTSALLPSATTLTLHGGGFDPNPANDQVVFAGGATGTVMAATATTLTVTGLSGLAAGPLLATVTVDGSAAAQVRVATVTPVAAAVLMADGSLLEYVSGSLPKLLSPAGTILSVATALDGNGMTDIFAITAAGNNVWEYTPTTSWSELSTGSFQQISATTNAAGQAMVFGVLTDGWFWQQNPAMGTGLNAGWTSLSPAGTIQSVSAVTESSGNYVVYAITQTPGYVGNVWEYSPSLAGSHWQQLSTGTFQQVSAGLNSAGQAVVYGVLTDGSLWEQDPSRGTGVDHGWQPLPAAGTMLAVSAGGPDTVFAIQSDNHLWEHSPSLPGNGWAMESSRLFSSLSATEDAAGQDDVFATLTDTSFYEYTAGSSGSTLQEILAGGVASSSTPTGPAN